MIVAPWTFNVLEPSIFALEAPLPGQTFVLRTSAGQLSADSPSTATIYCLNRVILSRTYRQIFAPRKFDVLKKYIYLVNSQLRLLHF